MVTVGIVLLIIVAFGFEVLWFLERSRREKLDRELKAAREGEARLAQIVQKQKAIIEKMGEARDVQKEYAALLEQELGCYKSLNKSLCNLCETLDKRCGGCCKELFKEGEHEL